MGTTYTENMGLTYEALESGQGFNLLRLRAKDFWADIRVDLQNKVRQLAVYGEPAIQPEEITAAVERFLKNHCQLITIRQLFRDGLKPLSIKIDKRGRCCGFTVIEY